MLIRVLEVHFDWSLESAYRAVFGLYALFALLKVGSSLVMSSRSEISHEPPVPAASGDSEATPSAGEEQPPQESEGRDVDAERRPLLSTPPAPRPSPAHSTISLILLLAPLFALDSFASSMIPSSFISYYLRLQFNASLPVISSLLSTGAVLSGVSSLAAGPLSRRVGLVKAMVIPHLPAQIFTISIGSWAKTSLGWTVGLFVARYCTASMDTPARSAFLAAVLPKQSRTKVMGVVNVAKTLTASVGPVRICLVCFAVYVECRLIRRPNVSECLRLARKSRHFEPGVHIDRSAEDRL
jgi:Major Facilitator Superfamily